MDILRISHYLAWNYGNTIGITPAKFTEIVRPFYFVPKDDSYFTIKLLSTGNKETYFYSCLSDMLSEGGNDALINCANMLKVPNEFINFWNFSKSSATMSGSEQEKEELIKLRNELSNIKPWNGKAATKFHHTIKKILDIVFSPNLINWTIEKEINEGRKRIDILYENHAVYGFFNWLNYIKRVDCWFVPVECKNYADDAENPEFDQLSWRLMAKTGDFWFLVVNKFTDEWKVTKNLKDIYNEKHEKVIIALDSSDIMKLIDSKLNQNEEEIQGMLMEKYKKVVVC